ncbi:MULTISPECIES: VWA domain-containing protein [Thiomicrorhabdus]|uniref:VWA domain-containing protein n=1 Tax=Thiomicrorhabdus heinhorstiae TaxID=2748010 RepID=A0ABS0BV82_9GAMM|nr:MULTISPECIES: VWA domain-containing protein [Thiomicrorhabdus]MBF6057733.1 VWA domain-containing protein [Thiomicrorhabdus heinhorstiae]
MELQLLRPWWLLAWIPAIWLLWKIWHLQLGQSGWQRLIAPQFHSLLLGDQYNRPNDSLQKLMVFALGLVWFFMTLTLAGPSVKTVKIPAQKSQQGTVIILDLSLSMLAQDLKPDRLKQAEFKIIDLLHKHPELAVGLVGYAGSAHTISPISEDNRTLLGLLPALNPLYMPSYGSDPLQAFKQAKQLLDGAHVNQGHLIWITDDVEQNQTADLTDWIKANHYSLSILSVGTAGGAPIPLPDGGFLKEPSGALVLPAVPERRFSTLSQQLDANYLHLNPAEEELDELLPPMNAAAKLDDEDNKSLKIPLDEGPFLLLILLPFIALFYRRGVLFTWLFAACLPAGMLWSDPTMAQPSLSEFSDVFQSPDQQAYKAWEKKNYAAAEALFENKQWRASSLYRLGRYKEAAHLFSLDHSAQGHYNRGNALARSGQLQEAAKAYRQALKQQTDFKEAKDNLTLIESLLKQQQQGQNNNSNNQQIPPQSPAQNSDKQESKDSQKKTAKSGQEEQQTGNQTSQSGSPPSEEQDSQKASDGQSKDSAQNASSNSAQNGQQGENQSGKPSDGKTDADANSPSESGENQSTSREINRGDKDQDKEPELGGASRIGDSNDGTVMSQQQREQLQATQNWLQQIPDEPQKFLQRKFEYQYQQSPSQGSQSDKVW